MEIKEVRKEWNVLRGIKGIAYSFCEWIMQMAYINLLFIMFTLLGLIVMGIFPATIGMFAIEKRLIEGEKDLPIFKTFWKEYKENFFKVNYIGLLFYLLTFVILFYLWFFYQYQVVGFDYIFYGFIVLLLEVFMTILFFFNVFITYDMKSLEYIRFSLLTALSRPIDSLVIILGLLVISVINVLLPGLLPFFSGSVAAYFIVWVSSFSLKKIAERSKKISEI